MMPLLISCPANGLCLSKPGWASQIMPIPWGFHRRPCPLNPVRNSLPVLFARFAEYYPALRVGRQLRIVAQWAASRY
jgi:hypothetical protein